MIYKSFEIVNFKGVDNVVVDLSNNRIITLVGLNESGKTTIMEAINLFHKLIKGMEPDEKILNKIRPKGAAFTGEISIAGKLIFEDEDKKEIAKYWKDELNKRNNLEFPEEWSYTFRFEFNLNAFQRMRRNPIFNVSYTSSSGSKQILSKKNFTAWQELVKFISKNIVPEVLYYEDFIFDIPDEIFFPKTIDPSEITVPVTQNDPNEKQQAIWRLVLDDVIRTVHPEMTIQAQVADKFDTDKDGVDNIISKMAGELDEKITKAWKELFSTAGKISFKEIALVCEPDGNGVNLSFKVKTHSNEVLSVNEKSKGFKWFFAFLLFTEFRKNRSKNILFLLDEPASNLHSSAQQKLLNAISQLSDKSLVIYSTHSHHLVNPDWLAGAYVVMNENITKENLSGDINLQEGAKISAIKYYNYVGKGLSSDNVSYFQPILDALDYQPSTVEPIPNIVITEGKNDWYTFKYLEESILGRSAKLNFYPGAGRDKLYDIIRLYLAWGKGFTVLLDGDNPGERSKDKYIKEFGEYIKDKIFTLKDITGKQGATESLFGKMDKRAIYDEVYGAGSFNQLMKTKPEKLKENLNYAITQLQFQKKIVTLNESTKKIFGSIFDFLESKKV